MNNKLYIKGFNIGAFTAMIIVALTIMFSSCATMGPNQTFMVADKEFTLTLERYNDYFSEAAPAQQAKWKADVDPVFKDASLALDVWKLVLNKPGAEDGDAEEAEERYLEAKRKLLKVLAAEVF